MADPKHSDRRTEATIRYAEEWCDAQPTVNGFAIDESVGIIRSLIARLVEHDS